MCASAPARGGVGGERKDWGGFAKKKTSFLIFCPRPCALADVRGFYEPLSLALEFLQPVKRRRGKSSEDDPAGGKKRRRCRVSDEEYERLRLAKMVQHRPYHQPAFPLLPAKDEAARPTRGVVIASAVQPSAAQAC